MTDEDLNRICDERAGGPFMRVTLDDLTPPAPDAAAHVNETPKTEHDAGKVLTDAALIARLREIQGQAGLFASAAADRIGALVRERDDLIHDLERIKDSETEQLNRAERLEAALRKAEQDFYEAANRFQDEDYEGPHEKFTVPVVCHVKPYFDMHMKHLDNSARAIRAALEGNTHDA